MTPLQQQIKAALEWLQTRPLTPAVRELIATYCIAIQEVLKG